MKANTDTRSAFTLIELLVVIAIIGTLAAITASYTAGAKARARSVECQKNLGTWAKALNMFIDESRTHAFPDAGSGAVADTAAWYNILAKMLDEKPLSDYGEGEKVPAPKAGIKSVYVCPEADNREDRNAIFSYAYNRHLVKDGKKLRAPQMKNPSELVAFMDAPRASAHAADETQVLSETTQSFRHGAMINIAFCDGHVGSFKLPQVLQGSENPTEVSNFGILWNPWEDSGEGTGSK